MRTPTRVTILGCIPARYYSHVREREHEGFVACTLYREIPPRVEYALTDKGCTGQRST